MDDSQAFASKLEERLDARRGRLDRAELPRLKNAFKLFQTALQGISGVLLKKGLIHEDPYKYDLKISEVLTPPEGPFGEAEKSDQMSLRLSQFDSYMDFLNNYYQFEADFLTLGRIKRLLSLVKYFNFTQFTETSTSVNTKVLAEMVGSVKKGGDTLSSGILGEATSQLDKATREILSILKELMAYHRERYKVDFRHLAGAAICFDSDNLASHKDEAIRQVKRRLAETGVSLPFYPELVEEVLFEDCGADAENLREGILARFPLEEEKKVEATKARSYKGVILEGLRVLAGVNVTLETAIQKLGEASTIIEAHNQGFMAKLKAAIRKVFSPEERGLNYEIELIDPVTGARSTESVDFGAFVEEGGRKARNLGGLMQKNGPSWRRLETATDEQVFKFLEKTMEELQALLRRMNALEEYFRSEAGPEEKGRLRSIKVEVTTIKGALIKANQKKHEYVAQKEEIEQMKRLGISSD